MTQSLDRIAELCSVGTRVFVIIPEKTENDEWMVIPSLRKWENHILPKGYKGAGWGLVTAISTDKKRTENGKRPVQVQDHIYCEFDEKLWLEHLKLKEEGL